MQKLVINNSNNTKNKVTSSHDDIVNYDKEYDKELKNYDKPYNFNDYQLKKEKNALISSKNEQKSLENVNTKTRNEEPILNKNNNGTILTLNNDNVIMRDVTLDSNVFSTRREGKNKEKQAIFQNEVTNNVDNKSDNSNMINNIKTIDVSNENKENDNKQLNKNSSLAEINKKKAENF